VGAFAYSHGLEGAVDQGWVRDGAALEDWLRDVLDHGAGRADAILLAAAYRADSAARLSEIDRTARALASSKERLLETDAQGAAFGTAVTVWGIALDGLSYPVALGAAAAQAGLPLALTRKMYLQAVLSNLIAAGQRLLPLGQQQALGILRRLSARCETLADATAGEDLDSLSTQAFLSDIAAMRHETQYSRIFRT
jgi:urease accessory protein